MNNARWEHTASMLKDGKVLVTDGFNDDGFLKTAELYDPITETWTSTGSMKFERSRHIASVLTNGKVLVVGGDYPDGFLNNAEFF